MIEKWLRFILGWFRTTLDVKVIETDDVMVVEHDLGSHSGHRWKGRLRLRSQRKELEVRCGYWWVPTRRYEQYDVSGILYSATGNEVILPPLTFPRMGWSFRIAKQLAHSLAIEAFVDHLSTLDRGV